MKKHIKTHTKSRNYGFEDIEAAGSHSLEFLFKENGSVLEPSGHNFLTSCPFHKDKKKSCCIFPHNNHFHCINCHAHGNAIDYIMKLENMSFSEVMESMFG